MHSNCTGSPSSKHSNRWSNLRYKEVVQRARQNEAEYGDRIFAISKYVKTLKLQLAEQQDVIIKRDLLIEGMKLIFNKATVIHDAQFGQLELQLADTIRDAKWKNITDLYLALNPHEDSPNPHEESSSKEMVWREKTINKARKFKSKSKTVPPSTGSK